MASDPAIIPNADRFRIFNVLPPAAHVSFVGGGEDGNVGPEHDPVADGDNGTVQDGEVKIGIKALPDADIAAVVDGKGWVDDDLFVADMTEDLAQELESGLVHVVRVGDVGEVVVVMHGPSPGLDPGRDKAGLYTVVTAVVSFFGAENIIHAPGDQAYATSPRHSQHARNHLLILISARHMGKSRCFGDLLLVFLSGSHDDQGSNLSYELSE